MVGVRSERKLWKLKRLTHHICRSCEEGSSAEEEALLISVLIQGVEEALRTPRLVQGVKGEL